LTRANDDVVPPPQSNTPASLRAPLVGADEHARHPGRAPKATTGPFSRSLGDRSMFSGDLPAVALLRSLLNPSVILASLAGCVAWYGVKFDGHYLMLAVLAFFVSAQLFDRIDLFRLRPSELIVRAGRDVLFAWPLTAAIVGFIVYATHYDQIYDRRVLIAWFVATPFVIVGAHLFAHFFVRALAQRPAVEKRVAVVGASRLSLRVVETILADPLLGVSMVGFFDDRNPSRLPDLNGYRLLGNTADAARVVRENNVNLVFISLPMVAQPRILKLLDELRDTTASIYFVPDIMAFDLIQARYDEIDGMPVVAVCETPYAGVNAALKRTFDIAFTLCALAVLWPILLACAVGVKLSSPGPVIFKQRRYGVDGREIYVYKFRSMRVQEDGAVVPQAKRNDPRVTRFGAFLRKTSLDELPQLFNVLAGSMSIVGPRPHAIAHNEQYRKLIKGYMLRHKVQPGITGWAQVNGYRGETDTLDKMRGRVEHDLYYLRNWSLSLDLWIIVKTVFVLFRDKNAY
jgi:putative colanic acid biosynthesis UDP-glucose lipid carrier transferase